MMSDLWMGFRALFRRGRVEGELEEELRFDFEQRVEKHVRAGMTREEARRRARLEFGGEEQIKEECRDARGIHLLETVAQDVRYGLRMLRKSPGFTIVAILTLALGIGANTAIFSIIDAVLLRPLPVENPQQLVVFRWSARHKPNIDGTSGYGDCDDRKGHCSFSLPFFRSIRGQIDTLSSLAAFAGPVDVDFSGSGPADITRGTYVSDDFFSTLGVTMLLGRPLDPADDSASAPAAIVLSYGYWQRAFSGERSVIGRSVRLDNVPATIVGVTDPHFSSLTPGKAEDFYMPFALADRVRGEWWGHQARVSDASIWWVVIVGRLKPGVSTGEAQAAATTIFRHQMLHGSRPVFKEGDTPAISLEPARGGLNGETSGITPALYLTMAMVGFVLLISCANIAGLAVARSASRQKEMAVRLALGARRSRIMRQILTESLLLSLGGGLLAVLVAVWVIAGVTTLMSRGSNRPFPFVVATDWRVLAFAAGVTLATGILFGLAPALRGARVDLTPSLKESASTIPGVAQPGRFFALGDALVVAQVALSIVVLIGAGLLIRTLRNLETLNPGFDTRNVLIFGIDPTLAGYTDQQTAQVYDKLQQRLAAVPGVISVSYSEDALLAGGLSGTDVHLEGTAPKASVNTDTLPVGLHFFSTMRIPLLAGRAFTAADFAAAAASNAAREAKSAAAAKNLAAPSAATAAALSAAAEAYGHAGPVPVIINEAFARKFFPNRNPVGMHMGDPDWPDTGPGYAIVAMVGDTKYAYLRRKVAPIMFIPLVQDVAHFELRSSADPSALIRTVRQIVSDAGDNLPLFDVRTQTAQIEQILFRERLMSRVSGFLGGLALALACIGLYGLLSYEVVRRTRELGIRMALGAQHRDLLRLVIGQGLLLVLVGAAVGLAAAAGLTRFVASMLYGLQASDPATFAGVAILLTLVALLACYLPARRAMRVDPLAALRHE
jgi:predicted permease